MINFYEFFCIGKYFKIFFFFKSSLFLNLATRSSSITSNPLLISYLSFKFMSLCDEPTPRGEEDR